MKVSDIIQNITEIQNNDWVRLMNEDELEQLQIRYKTAGNGYGHFKLDLMDKIYEYFTPYRQKREEYNHASR